jgi:hypothetical protein
MNFHTRKWVKPEDLNPNGTLFGGSLLRWIDEEPRSMGEVQEWQFLRYTVELNRPACEGGTC